MLPEAEEEEEAEESARDDYYHDLERDAGMERVPFIRNEGTPLPSYGFVDRSIFEDVDT